MWRHVSYKAEIIFLAWVDFYQTDVRIRLSKNNAKAIAHNVVGLLSNTELASLGNSAFRD